MKKIALFLATAAMLSLFAACTNSGQGNEIVINDKTPTSVSATDAVTEAVPQTAAQTVETTAAPAANGTITEADAKKIALTDAGLTENQVTFTEVEFETDGSMTYYDIAFVNEGKEYEYTIEASKGTILEKDIDAYDEDFDD